MCLRAWGVVGTTSLCVGYSYGRSDHIRTSVSFASRSAERPAPNIVPDSAFVRAGGLRERHALHVKCVWKMTYTKAFLRSLPAGRTNNGGGV